MPVWSKVAPVLLTVVFWSCGAAAADPLAVTGAWVRPSIGTTGSSALYLSLYNAGPVDDALVAVTTDAAVQSQLHMTESSNGVVGMRAMVTLPLPIGKMAAMAPKGDHVMLMGLTRSLKTGDHVAIELRFKIHAPMMVDAIVSMTPPQ